MKRGGVVLIDLKVAGHFFRGEGEGGGFRPVLKKNKTYQSHILVAGKLPSSMILTHIK